MDGNDTESEKRLQAGQMSSAKRFLFVGEAIRDEVLEELVEPFDVAWRVGHKVWPNTDSEAARTQSD